MFDTSFLAPPEAGFQSRADTSPYQEALIGVQGLREIALQQAHELASQYVSRRTSLQKSDGDGFIGIALYVRERNERRSVQLEWAVGHFKGGKYTGSTSIPKRRRTSEYDLSLLKRETPPWAHELVVETELQARVIREALMRLTEADTALKVATRRLQQTNEAANPDAEKIGPDGHQMEHAQ